MHVDRKLISIVDASANLIFDNRLEARYVQREEDYFIVYLSSHDGCNKACRFCHLTQTKQTSFNPASLGDYNEQAIQVLFHYQDKLAAGLKPVNRINFNFMARGEPLANSDMLDVPHKVLWSLAGHALRFADTLGVKFNISTIMPEEVRYKDLARAYSKVKHPHSFYYSLYSVNPKFRKKWLPKAIEVPLALDKLKAWQEATGQILTFHWAFIDGENDSIDDLDAIIEVLAPYDFHAKFNVVRYNPFSVKQGKESPEEIVQRNFHYLSSFFGDTGSRIVPRVGFDVHASCGTFYDI